MRRYCGRVGSVLSHPNDKNKDVVRMGHPAVVRLIDNTILS